MTTGRNQNGRRIVQADRDGCRALRTELAHAPRREPDLQPISPDAALEGEAQQRFRHHSAHGGGTEFPCSRSDAGHAVAHTVFRIFQNGVVRINQYRAIR